MTDDKLYIIVILAMVGIFMYYYQTHIKNNLCRKCKKRKYKKNKSKKKLDDDIKPILKNVKFKDNESEISLDSLESSEHVARNNNKNDNDNDSRSCDTLDI